MEDQNNHTSPVSSQTHIYYYVIWTVVALGIIGGVVYFAMHIQKLTPAITPPPKNTQIPTTYASAPVMGFPQEIIPKNGTVPQYFDNAQAIGSIYLIKEPLVQAEAEYEKQVTALKSWTIQSKQLNPPQDVLVLFNAKTTATAQVIIQSLSEGTTTLTVSLKK